MISLIREVINQHLIQQGEQNIHRFSIEMPNNIANGHLSTNVLMVYRNKVIGKALIEQITNIQFIDKVEYVEPGFINIFLQPNCLQNIETAWNEIKRFKNINISVEYASPNPTGPCHIGHARGSITGDIISSILIHLGYNVRKDCIFNDGGKQVEKFIESIYIRYKELRGEATQEEITNIFYKGQYIKDLAAPYKDKKSLTLQDFMHEKSNIMEVMKREMKADLKLLKIEHDTITNESDLKKEKDICWEQLEKEGLLEFEVTENGNKKIYFKSKDFEDDKDRVIEREDGTITYFGNDIAYHWKKKYGLSSDIFSEQIIVLGDDHIGYLKRLLGAVSNFGINLRVVTHNLVKIMKNQVELKMSKRNGNFITIRDFIHKYGNEDILRILMIEQGTRSVVNLDLNKLNLEDSPLFYIQYAYTRIFSILQKKTFKKDSLQLALLKEEEEQLLISYLVYWPELIIKVGKTLDVHGLFIYTQGFTKVIHSYLSNHKIIQEELGDRTNARLYLLAKCRALLITILEILKITPLEKM